MNIKRSQVLYGWAIFRVFLAGYVAVQGMITFMVLFPLTYPAFDAIYVRVREDDLVVMTWLLKVLPPSIMVAFLIVFGYVIYRIVPVEQIREICRSRPKPQPQQNTYEEVFIV